MKDKDGITAQLTAIYDAATKQREDSRARFKESGRANHKFTEDLFSIYAAESKAINKAAFVEAVTLLQAHSSDHLPILAAIYFHDAYRRQGQIVAILESKSDLRKLASDRREQLARERALRKETREQLLWAKELIAREKQARRKGADMLHQEHRAIKADVFAWLDANTVKFKSNEAAATAIERQAPIAHVTARDWYKEWKKLQSASRP